MEERQRSDKAELERMQQEVETQRKETEIVQRQIRKQEESLKRRSFHIENKLKDLLAEKEKFQEERMREQQEIELQKKRREEGSFLRIKEELQQLQELNRNEQVEKILIFQELDQLHREKDEQCTQLELEKRRLDEQEKEQVLLPAHKEEQLREKEEMVLLLHGGEIQCAEEEKRELEGIWETLLQARESQAGSNHDGEELEKAQLHFLEFKRRQLVKLTNLEKDLVQQKDLLRKEIQEEQKALEHLKYENDEESRLLATNDDDVTDVASVVQDLEKMKLAEYRLQCKEHQLQSLLQNHLPVLLEEKQRVLDILDRGPLGLHNTVYQVEKEMKEKEEQLIQYQASASQVEHLQATFEFTTNVKQQGEKVREKGKEILESKEKQQREALEQAVDKLEKRQSVLQRHSTLGLEIQEQRQKFAILNSSGSKQPGLPASLEPDQEALEKDPERLQNEILQLKQKICEVDSIQRGHCGTLEGKDASSVLLSSADKSHLATLMDSRISAYIEEEVQRRLQDLHHTMDDAGKASADMMRDNEKLHNGTIQRKLKYERMVSRSLGANPDDLKDPIKISIPRYVLCGQGKDEHFEFEVKITVLDETWTVFRRYSRFREMHKTLKLKYSELAALEFPPKKLFGNKDERVIAERRSHLEKYLRNFFSVMLQSATSPLHINKVGLTLSKHTICEFSPFFKKGVFDYSSHGTG
nr:kinesin-like protein KIF16B [Castor canadensis]